MHARLAPAGLECRLGNDHDPGRAGVAPRDAPDCGIEVRHEGAAGRFIGAGAGGRGGSSASRAEEEKKGSASEKDVPQLH
jgi:hypothetical protein